MSGVDALMERAFREWRAEVPSPDLRSRFEKRLAVARALEDAFASWDPVRAERAFEFDSKLEAQRELEAELSGIAVTPSIGSVSRFAARLPRGRRWGLVSLSYAALLLVSVGLVLFAPRVPVPGPPGTPPRLSFAQEAYLERLLAGYEERRRAIGAALDRLAVSGVEAAVRELRADRSLAAAETVRRLKRVGSGERALYLRLLAELGAAKELYRCAIDDPWHSQEALEALVQVEELSARPWFERAARNPRTRTEFFEAAARKGGETTFRYLCEMLNDPSLRAHALDALVRRSDPRAIRELASLLADPGGGQMVVRPDGAVRSNEMTSGFKRRLIAALGALSERATTALPDSFAVEVLIEVMSDERFRDDARASLRRILDRDFGPDPAQWRRGVFRAGG